VEYTSTLGTSSGWINGKLQNSGSQDLLFCSVKKTRQIGVFRPSLDAKFFAKEQ
jgi:hypothetical protein